MIKKYVVNVDEKFNSTFFFQKYSFKTKASLCGPSPDDTKLNNVGGEMQFLGIYM